jgi:hypothetical protein
MKLISRSGSTMEGNLNRLIVAGLNDTFLSGNYYDRTVRTELGRQLLVNPAFEPYFDSLFESTNTSRILWLNRIAKTFKGGYAELTDYWREKFISLATTENIKENIADYCSDNLAYLDYGISLSDSLDTFEVFKLVYNHTCNYNWYNGRLGSITSKLAEESPLSFKLFVDSHIFKNKIGKSTVRGHMYAKYIQQGLLTEKTARKIRSESSAEASNMGLSALIQSKDEYQNYTDLLLTFTDSRHDDVLYTLARELPVYMLSSLLGCENEWVKRIVEQRMEAGE